MKTITLNNDLDPLPFSSISYKPNATAAASMLWDDITTTSAVKHQNYIEYLSACYAAHRGAVINPSILWYTIVSELAVYVAGKPEEFRHLFSTSSGKKTIAVQGEASLSMPAHFLPALKEAVPMSFPFPAFTTNTEGYDIAIGAAFCDMCSPYYDYLMFRCGIPFVQVEGTDEDWKLLQSLIKELHFTFRPTDYFTNKGLDPWFESLRLLIDQIRFDASKEFWTDIFGRKNCGSGHPDACTGWFLKFFIDRPLGNAVVNCNSHVSKFTVTQLESGEKYQFRAGLLSSIDTGKMLQPQFNCRRDKL